MQGQRRSRHPHHLKLVIAGPPDCGKSQFMQALAQRYSSGTLREHKVGTMDVMRLDLPWQEPNNQNVTNFPVHIHSLVGNIRYSSLYELILSNCHAILMMIDLNPQRKGETLQIMIQTADVLRLQGLDIRKIPMIFQYHRAELATPDIVQQWDDLLDLHNTNVPRYFSTTDFVDGSFAGIELLINETRKLMRPTINHLADA